MNRIVSSFYYVVGFVVGFTQEARSHRRYTRVMNAPCQCARCRHGIEGCHWEGFELNSDGVFTYKGEIV